MSNALKIIGIIIAIIGGLAYFASMSNFQSDTAKMGLQVLALPHFMKTMKAFVGEVIVIGIGLAIIIIGVKFCRSSK
ncbi:MAG: hypothetical protein HY295_01030 [Thaumarchaeota archaeon]|nr:hypothetical protein [Nitrososphaerota archaeon]